MFRNSLIELIKTHELPCSDKGMILDRIDATIKYIDLHTADNSIIHCNYKTYKRERKFCPNHFLYIIFVPFVALLIIGILNTVFNLSPSLAYKINGVILFVAFVCFATLLLMLFYYIYIYRKYKAKIKLYVNYLECRESHTINNFDYYLAGELGLGPKITKGYGFNFRRKKRKMQMDLIDELPVENYGPIPKKGMRLNIINHRFINKIIYVAYLLLLLRFLYVNDGQQHHLIEVVIWLVYCFRYNSWIFILVLYVGVMHLINIRPISRRIMQIEDALLDYIDNHKTEVDQILNKLKKLS